MKKLGIWMASKQGADDGVIMCRCDYQTDNLLVPHQFQAFSTQLKSAHLSQPIQEKKNNCIAST